MDIKNIIITVGLVLIAILVVVCINQRSKINNLKSSSPVLIHDTVHVNHYFEPKKEYKVLEIPKLVTFYLVDSVPPIVDIQIKQDTIRFVYEDSTFQDISPRFITSHPDADKLIQMILSDNNLKLSLMNTKGEVFTKEYDINTEVREYNYVNNNLTSNRKSFFKKITPTIKTMVRPFNNMYDLSIGLKYNTSKFKYELGLNTFYYPGFSRKIGNDMYIGLSYEF